MPPHMMNNNNNNNTTLTGSHRGRQRQQSNQTNNQGNTTNNPIWNTFAKIQQNIELAKKGYDQLVQAIIRPPRANYTMDQLGPSDFTFLQQRFHRDDVVLTTQNVLHDPEGEQQEQQESSSTTDEQQQPIYLKLHASIWTRVEENNAEEQKQNTTANDNDKNNKTKKTKTMVVYLHGNASARTEVLPNLGFLLAQGIFGVASLDFTGSGKSDGKYVSLGYYERFDLECLLQYLNDTYGPHLEIVLWGRSMGASTALMHASEKTQETILYEQQRQATWSETNAEEYENFTIAENSNSNNNNKDSIPNEMSGCSTTILKGIICDSPFASLPILCEELVEKARSQGIVVPGTIVSVALALISRSVRYYANFDIREICPIEHTPTIDTPALFVVGANDDFIPPHHSEELIGTYKQGVSTNLFMVPGGHNDPRPDLVFEAVEQFLQHRLSVGGHHDHYAPLNVPTNLPKKVLNRNPPWAYKAHANLFQAHDIYSAPVSSSSSSMMMNTAQQQAEELGMTKERQDDIQNKLHTMLGQGNADDN